MPAYSSLFEMDPDNDLVIIGSEYGIYVTEQLNGSSTSWKEENASLGTVPVMMLKQQIISKEADEVPTGGGEYEYWPGVNNFGVIYGATFGRGLISLDEFQQPVGIGELVTGNASEASFKLYPNPATDHLVVSFNIDFQVAIMLAAIFEHAIGAIYFRCVRMRQENPVGVFRVFHRPA